ncbi:MAG TPA: serpin family protein, partial [Ilumatobacteraceae bacterium]|nr:serpin family protein [Ilumatobacteraceae bacterium]
FSPASIAIALAMVRAGAAGATATEMDTVLHVTDPAALAPSMNGLQLALDARTHAANSTLGREQVTLSIGNSLWGQVGYRFEQTFLDTLAANYDAGMQLVDYKADAEGARQMINAWVAEQTRDRIAQLLAPDILSPDVRLTLVNTIYLKAPWGSQFNRDL